MARCPLVKPEVLRVPLSGEDFLDLKRELNAGEYRNMIIVQFKETMVGDRMAVDLQNMGMSKVLAYVVGWSFVDFDGQPLPVSRETIDMLDAETFQEIMTAIEAHHEAWEKAVDARKNAQSGAIRSVAISSSAA